MRTAWTWTASLGALAFGWNLCACSTAVDPASDDGGAADTFVPGDAAGEAAPADAGPAGDARSDSPSGSEDATAASDGSHADGHAGSEGGSTPHDGAAGATDGSADASVSDAAGAADGDDEASVGTDDAAPPGDAAVVESGGCVPTCSGRACGDDGCGGSCGVCSSGSCSASGQCTATCGGEACSDGAACCGADPYCTGQAPGARGCRATCGAVGEACASGGDCCSHMRCIDGACSQSAADCAGDSCSGSQQCCSASARCVGLFGSTVRSCQAACGQGGDACSLDADCCGGLSCLSGTCGSTAGYHWRTDVVSVGALQGLTKIGSAGVEMQVHVQDPPFGYSVVLHDADGNGWELSSSAWSPIVTGGLMYVELMPTGGATSPGGAVVDAIRSLVPDATDATPACQNGTLHVGPGYLEGWTFFLPDVPDGSCVPSGVISHAAGFAFVAPADGPYTFSASMNGSGGYLYVRKDDCAGAELACVGANTTADVAMKAGERVLVFVDDVSDYTDPSSFYALNVAACQPLTCDSANCGSMPDGCGGTLQCGTCTSPDVCSSTTSIGLCCSAHGASCLSSTTCCSSTCSNGQCL
jgi:hypothetical protein